MVIFDPFVLTLDTDWAPDCVLNAIADIFLRKRIRATWFVTYDFPGIRQLCELAKSVRLSPLFN